MGVEEKETSKLAIKQVLSQEIEITTFLSPNTGKPVIIDGHVDDAIEYADNDEGPFILDPEEDKKVLRKIDFYLMPLICITYCVQFMDKQTVSFGAILGLRKDLKMVGDQYSWAGSAFVLGIFFTNSLDHTLFKNLNLAGYYLFILFFGESFFVYIQFLNILVLLF